MSPSEPTADLQFDSAELPSTATGATCELCKEPITRDYYKVGGRVTCEGCRAQVEQSYAETLGSGRARFLRALGFGLGASVIGGAAYYAVTKITGYELGLISVFVGLFVGRAVRKGSRGLGGRAYQVLGVVLAYLAMAGSYAPFVVQGLMDRESARTAAATQAAPAPAYVEEEDLHREEHDEAAAARGEPAPIAEAAVPAAEPRAATTAEGGSVGMALLFLLGTFLALPVLVGMESPISGLIVAFALWEAWKVNKLAKLNIEGPFAVAAAAASPVAIGS